MGVFFNRFVKKASYFTGGSIWQRNRLKKLLTQTKKKDRGNVFNYWPKTIRNVCQITTDIVSRRFLAGDVVEKFQRKLNYEVRSVCPKKLSSVQRNFRAKEFLREKLRVCQNSKENNWARISEIHFNSCEYHYGMTFFSKNLRIMLRFPGKKIWRGLSNL